LLCDTDRSLGLAYEACETPDAKVPARISYLIGPDGRIRAAYSKVSPPTHPAEVLKELEGAGDRPTEVSV
jgi:peroxiredoxin Q/BCP